MDIVPEQFLRALSDPTRLRILMLLLENEELCVCELVDAMDMVQPKISRHLAALRETGVVLDRRDGLWIHYRIHPEMPVWAFRTLKDVREGCNEKAPYLADKKRLRTMKNHPDASCGPVTRKLA